MTPLKSIATALAATLVLSGCGGKSDDSGGNPLPTNVTQQGVTIYPAIAPGDGTTATSQDLLTAGLGAGLAGASGLGQATAPSYADPLNPTALELRRNAIYSNYRGLVDPTANGGYGTLYGPNVDVNGVAGTANGMIPGREYIGSLDDGSGMKRVTIAVQIPDSFSRSAPCLVLGPSSGSRGVYGAIATAGEWGLKHGCAVALVDAGKGIGLYDMTDDTVNKIDGTRATRSAAGVLDFFAANITDAARAAYNALYPNRLALKQAQSQLNPEKDWGSDTLAAANYAFWALNDRYGALGDTTPFGPANTLVIAGSTSSGGAAVLRAAEQDSAGVIDGVVAAEPVTELPATGTYGILFNGAAVTGFGRRLIDSTTYGNIYQPCAALASSAALTESSFFNYLSDQNARAVSRCQALNAKGLVSGTGTAAWAADALDKLHNYGWTVDHDQMHNAYYGFGNAPILSAMYTMMYGRASVTDNLCNTSYAQVDPTTGAVVAVTPASKAQSYAIGNGTANGTADPTPGGPASVVYNTSVGGARAWNAATSPSTNAQDFGLDVALCQRALVTGLDETGAALTGTATSTRPTAAQSAAVQAGIAETLVTGNLHAKPTLIVAGRSDALVPVNNNARAYTAYNRLVEGTTSQVSYIEVMNAQHFDSFNQLSGFDTRYVPLHVYFVRAMDAMYAHLKSNAALPPSQVVRTTPRGGLPGSAPAITAAAVPAVSSTPTTANAIGFSGTSLTVPN